MNNLPKERYISNKSSSLLLFQALEFVICFSTPKKLMESPDQINKLAKKTAKYIEKLNKALLSSGLERPPQSVIDKLTVPVCLLAKILHPDVRQKLDEFLFASTHPELQVNTHQHGADLIDPITDSATELKVATCIQNPKPTKQKNGTMKTPKPAIAVMWPIPKPNPKNPEERRKKLLKSIKEKTDSGGAVIRVVNGMQTLLKEYRLSHEFLMGYFERVKLGNSPAHNMGCLMCPSCKSFHRLDKLQAFSNKLPKTEEEWKKVFEEVASDCKTKS